jgi:phosphoribosylaminoimidazole carboxylase PurE protein
VNEGKTKRIYEDLTDPLGVILEAKDDITAGDGAKRDVIPNKRVLATQTTCNVFELLRAAGISVAYNERIDEQSFSAVRSNMLLLEIVLRREAHGSFNVRYPHVPKGTIFPRLVFELFLKTTGKKWKGVDLPCDDPLAVYVPHKDGFDLYDVKKPFMGQTPFHFVPAAEVFGAGVSGAEKIELLEQIGRQTFLTLERQWQLFGRRLVDFKIECDDQFRVSDVIDSDSWRLVKDGRYEDKQVYRDGGKLSEVAANYRRVAELSDRFGLPNQRIILWRGSESDSVKDVREAFETLSANAEVSMHIATCSIHKRSESGLQFLRQLEQECPDSVIIALIGRSNGAGPTLQAHTTLPVINCSPSVKDFHEDVWSSLRMPSEVPCVTVLEPANAAHAALNILSARNPALYAALRYRMEERFVNSIPL